MNFLNSAFKFAFAFLILLSSTGFSQNLEQYTVSSQTLNIRSGPGKNFSIVSTLTQGDAVQILEKESNGWWKIKFSEIEGYVFSQYLAEDIYAGWEKKEYRSGSTPECENVNPQFDYKIDNVLRVNVGSNTDVVIKLMKIGYKSDECIRIVYVRSGEKYDIKNIPEGRYYLKIAYGKDYRQKIVDNQCYVKFMKNAQYEKGSDILDFNLIKKPDTKVGREVYANWEVPSFELDLDVIVTNKYEKNTFHSKNINEAEFNK